MRLDTVRNKLLTAIKLWDRHPNEGSYYLKRITEIVNEANRVKAKKYEQRKARKVKAVIKRLNESNKGYT
jgi:hypothetical protein